MIVKGYFTKGILNMVQNEVNIFEEVCSEIDKGNCTACDIRDGILEKYGVKAGDLEAREYLDIDDSSLQVNEFNSREVTFAIDCNFDMERYAQDHDLEPAEQERD